jgi:hypothetical protein
MNSIGQLTRGGPVRWGLNVGLTSLYWKNIIRFHVPQSQIWSYIEVITVLLCVEVHACSRLPLTALPWQRSSHKVQNPLTANDQHSIARVITTQSFILSHKAQNPLTANDHQLTKLPTDIAYCIDGLQIQLLPQRRHSASLLLRSINWCCLEQKSLFILSIIWSKYIRWAECRIIEYWGKWYHCALKINGKFCNNLSQTVGVHSWKTPPAADKTSALCEAECWGNRGCW